MPTQIQNVNQLRQQSLPDIYSERNVHDAVKHLSVDELRSVTAEQTYPFQVMLMNVLGDINIGTVIRSAHLMGAERCVVFGRRRIDNRGLVGAANYTPVDKIWAVDDNLEIQAPQFVDHCGTHGLMPVFVEQGGENCYQVDWQQIKAQCDQHSRKILLVVGTEKEGIPADIIDAGLGMGGRVVSIPQRGVIRSHNLSMAFAVVASQMVRDLGWY